VLVFMATRPGNLSTISSNFFIIIFPSWYLNLIKVVYFISNILSLESLRKVKKQINKTS
jgi:hypothetical protein